MSNNESSVRTDDQANSDASSVTNTTTPVRLFGQFKQNGTGFSSFGQLSSNGDNAPPAATSYFTSTLSKISSTSSGGFGSSSTSLAASLAPLSSKQLFGVTSEATPKKDDEDDTEQDDDEEENNKSTPSLFDTAAEYEAKRATNHPSATIQGDTSTGEEHEVTKFQMAGKLYMYNPDQREFAERGYGILKINECRDPADLNKLQARIIMRLDKAFRVILNSPIFPKMTVDHATDRSVRFGAQDESHLRIFTIKASASDCTNLCKELQSRIEMLERQQAASSNVTSPNENTLNNSASSSTSESSTTRIRKRSHSGNASDPSDNTNELSKRSKLLQGCQDDNKDTSDDDSVESTKAGEQETAI